LFHPGLQYESSYSNPNPAVPTVSKSGATTFCDGGNVELSVSNDPLNSYQWSNSEGPISGAITSNYIANKSELTDLISK